MPHTPVLIAAWARSAVVPRHGAFKALQPHELAAPVIQAVLSRAQVPLGEVDTVIVGNALGAGGNPARMAALHAGLPITCRSLSVDTQCCAGLDAVALGASLIQAGHAHVVVAGGVEAWSRSPLRMHRPLDANETPVPYERPAFAPTPEQDPDMLQAAADYAQRNAYSRDRQDAYALASHQRAVTHAALLHNEIVPMAGITQDAHPRALNAMRAARMPEVAPHMSVLAVSPQADGAAFVVLLSPSAAQRMGLEPQICWLAHASVGADPQMPMLAASAATQAVMQLAQINSIQQLAHIELHDAFAVQGLSFCQAWQLTPPDINRHGGGLARGHPIAASGAIALVRVLSDLQCSATPNAMGLAAIAGAGGLGSAALVRRLG
jgi:acetyl-CoA C-acetyltransferase